MNRQTRQKNPLYRYWLITLIILLVINLVLPPMLRNGATTQESYSSFLDKVEEKTCPKPKSTTAPFITSSRARMERPTLPRL